MDPKLFLVGSGPGSSFSDNFGSGSTIGTYLLILTFEWEGLEGGCLLDIGGRDGHAPVRGPLGHGRHQLTVRLLRLYGSSRLPQHHPAHNERVRLTAVIHIGTYRTLEWVLLVPNRVADPEPDPDLFSGSGCFPPDPDPGSGSFPSYIKLFVNWAFSNFQISWQENT